MGSWPFLAFTFIFWPSGLFAFNMFPSLCLSSTRSVFLFTLLIYNSKLLEDGYGYGILISHRTFFLFFVFHVCISLFLFYFFPFSMFMSCIQQELNCQCAEGLGEVEQQFCWYKLGGFAVSPHTHTYTYTKHTLLSEQATAWSSSSIWQLLTKALVRGNVPGLKVTIFLNSYLVVKI